MWSAVVDRWRWKNLAKMVGSLNMDVTLSVAAQQNEEGQKLRQFAEIIWKTSGLTNDNLQPTTEYIDKERPFLSPMTWALLSAYRQAINFPAAQVMVMRTGADPKILGRSETYIGHGESRPTALYSVLP